MRQRTGKYVGTHQRQESANRPGPKTNATIVSQKCFLKLTGLERSYKGTLTTVDLYPSVLLNRRARYRSRMTLCAA